MRPNVGISRKIDRSLPGAEAALAELGSVDLPRFQTGFPPQHLLLTLLGDYWSGVAEPIPSAALVELLGEFDVNPAGARAALSRLSARGVLQLTKAGRNTAYRLTDALAEPLAHAQRMTLRFGGPTGPWDEAWTIVAFSLPEPARHLRPMLRQRLRVLGFAPLFDGMWISPYPPDDHLVAGLAEFPDARSSVMRGSTVPVEGTVDPVRAWDLDDIRPGYDEFLREFVPLRDRSRDGGVDPSEALVARLRAVYQWFVIAEHDPDLPDEMLPAGWPRDDARVVFTQIVDGLAPLAELRVRQILGRHSADLAGLVTQPPLAVEVGATRSPRNGG